MDSRLKTCDLNRAKKTPLTSYCAESIEYKVHLT